MIFNILKSFCITPTVKQTNTCRHKTLWHPVPVGRGRGYQTNLIVPANYGEGYKTYQCCYRIVCVCVCVWGGVSLLMCVSVLGWNYCSWRAGGRGVVEEDKDCKQRFSHFFIRNTRLCCSNNRKHLGLSTET